MQSTANLARRATPWLDFPLVLSGNYREYECTLNDTAACEYQQGYWRFWYEADHRFALPTVAFLLAIVAVFAAAHLSSQFLGSLARPRPQQQQQQQKHLPAFVVRIRALWRYASTRRIRIASLDWNSAPIGLLTLGGLLFIFFIVMTLGPQPYYWPNTDMLDFGSSPPIATRTGWMALACLPFVFATAGKANPITLCTGISHEKLQIAHRWLSYAFLVLSLVHTFPFIVYNIQTHMMVEMWDMTVFYWTGVVALVAQGWLTFASWGPLRSWCYEWFKISHFAAALVFVVFLFFHCDATLTAWDYFIATGVLFASSWVYRHARIYFEHGLQHRADLSLESNGFIRVSVPVPASNTSTFTWVVGQHFFVRFVTMGLRLHVGTVHPFTACSLPMMIHRGSKEEVVEHEQTQVQTQAQGKNKTKQTTSELTFFIRPRGGTTSRLAHLARNNDNDTEAKARVRVLLDGPYGGVPAHSLLHSRRMLVIAGGSGSGWILPFVTTLLDRLEMFGNEHKVNGSRGGDHHRPSLRIVLAVRDIETADWFREQVRQLLAERDGVDGDDILLRNDLEIQVHLTGDAASVHKDTHTEKPRIHDASQEAVSPIYDLSVSAQKKEQLSTAEAIIDPSTPPRRDQQQHQQHQQQLFQGRPDLPAIIADESEAWSSSSLAVFVCGPLSMQSDVANAVAARQLSILRSGVGDVSLHLEHFSWA